MSIFFYLLIKKFKSYFKKLSNILFNFKSYITSLSISLKKSSVNQKRKKVYNKHYSNLSTKRILIR